MKKQNTSKYMIKNVKIVELNMSIATIFLNTECNTEFKCIEYNTRIQMFVL